jgi:WhiB family transcriptional regulator, redox-sensing transcriptional regulator
MGRQSFSVRVTTTSASPPIPSATVLPPEIATIFPGELSDAGHLFLLMAWRPAWHADAACRDYPDVNFFPVSGDSARPARAVCATCGERGDCLAWALEQGPELDGVWAGTTPADRQSIRDHGRPADRRMVGCRPNR